MNDLVQGRKISLEMIINLGKICRVKSFVLCLINSKCRTLNRYIKGTTMSIGTILNVTALTVREVDIFFVIVLKSFTA